MDGTINKEDAFKRFMGSPEKIPLTYSIEMYLVLSLNRYFHKHRIQYSGYSRQYLLDSIYVIAFLILLV